MKKKQIWSVSSVTAKSLSSIVVIKLFAYFLGPAGLTLFAHFQNLLALATYLLNEGYNRSLMRVVPERKSRIDHDIFFTSLLINIVTLALITALIFVFRDFFLYRFLEQTNYQLFLPLLLLGIILYATNLYVLSLLLSGHKLVRYALVQVSGSVLVAILVFWGVETESIGLSLLSYIFGQGSAALIGIVFLLQKKLIPFCKPSFSRKALRHLFIFIPMGLSVLIFTKFTDFVAREMAIRWFGFHLTGLWQSVVKLSDVYMNLFIATVGSVYYPQVSRLILDTDNLRIYLKDVLRVVLPVSFFGLLFIYVFRDSVLFILFSEIFMEADYLVKYRLTGDFFSIISYLLSYLIAAQARTTTFVVLQAGSAALYLLLIWFLAEPMGIHGFPMAHAIRYFIFFAILVVLNRRILF